MNTPPAERADCCGLCFLAFACHGRTTSMRFHTWSLYRLSVWRQVQDLHPSLWDQGCRHTYWWIPAQLQRAQHHNLLVLLVSKEAKGAACCLFCEGRCKISPPSPLETASGDKSCRAAEFPPVVCEDWSQHHLQALILVIQQSLQPWWVSIRLRRARCSSFFSHLIIFLNVIFLSPLSFLFHLFSY